MLIETLFLLALVMTWAIEIPILVILVRFVFRDTNLSLPAIVFTGAL